MNAPPRASIVITARDYGRFLGRCVDSALGQAYAGFETVVVDDGSTDDTPRILRGYGDRLRVVRTEGVGLAAASNRGIAASRGEYVVRLDADDWLDENLLAVEANLLDRHPDVGMVYPDYFLVDGAGELLGQTRLLRPYEESRLLDRNPLAAGALYRRACYDALGGYDETLKRQEDYDFWVRFTRRFKVRKVDLPLLYYRRHGANMSKAFSLRMQARRAVKAAQSPRRPKALGILWAPRRAQLSDPRAEGSWIERELAAAAGVLPRVALATDDGAIAQEARRAGADAHLVAAGTDPLEGSPAALAEVVRALSGGRAYEFVAWLQAGAPGRRADHIREALDSAALFDADAVLSVRRLEDPLWRPGAEGLLPAGEARSALKRESDILYEESPVIRLFKTSNLESGPWWGRRTTWIEVRAPRPADASAEER